MPSIAAASSASCIALIWRSSLAAPMTDAPREQPGFDRRQVGICGSARRASGAVCHPAAARGVGASDRRLSDRQPRPSHPPTARRDRPAAADPFCNAVRRQRRLCPNRPSRRGRAAARLPRPLPDRVVLLEPISLFLSNTIGNVPAVVMILKVWQGIPEGTLVGLAILSTLAGNLFLVGSLANLIVAERAKPQGVRLTFATTPTRRADHHPLDAVCRILALARGLHAAVAGAALPTAKAGPRPSRRKRRRLRRQASTRLPTKPVSRPWHASLICCCRPAPEIKGRLPWR